MVQKEERNKLLDVNVLRGGGGEILDHHLVIEKLRWSRKVVNMEERYEIKVSELRKVMCKTEYENKLNLRRERVREGGSREGGGGMEKV